MEKINSRNGLIDELHVADSVNCLKRKLSDEFGNQSMVVVFGIFRRRNKRVNKTK